MHRLLILIIIQITLLSGYRSFGEDKDKVVKFGVAYMKGMQDAGIMACAKHFPGHGDVDVDSHLDLAGDQ